ncbi:MAG: oligosaccharide flippase family protein [Pseudomonadota bacterium]
MKRNLIFTAIAIGSRLLTGLLLFLILARVWGPEQFGLFSFLFSASALLALVIDFGFAAYILREVSAAPDDTAVLLRSAFWAKCALVPVFVVAAGAAGWFMGAEVAPPQIFVPLVGAALVLSYCEFFIAPLRALGRFDIESAVVVAANLLQFVAVGCAAWSQGAGPALAAWVLLVCRVLFLAASIWAARRVVGGLQLSLPSAQAARTTFGRLWPYGVDGFLTTAWSQLDVLLVRLLYGVQVVGIYSAGQRLVQGLASLAPVVGNVMIPRLARAHGQRSARLVSDVRLTHLLLGAMGLVLALPLLFFAEPLVALLLGQQYGELVDLLPWLGLLVFVRYVAASAGVVITAIGMQRRRVAVQAVALCSLVLASVLLSSLSLQLNAFVLALVLSFSIIAAAYWWIWHGFSLGWQPANRE